MRTDRESVSGGGAWLQLLRPPNLFTVPGDPLAGAMITAACGGAVAGGRLGAAVGASLMLYCAGLLSNDYFDLEADRRERPERPLPSGAVRPRSAIAWAAVLAALGIGLASWCGTRCAAVALALALLVLLYNRTAKRFPVSGPLAMGACRALSLLLGAASAAWPVPPAAWVAAATLLLLIASVTLIARRETEAIRLGMIRWSPLAVSAIGLGGYVCWAMGRAPASELTRWGTVLVALGAIVWMGDCGRCLDGRMPVPACVGRLIRGLLLVQAAWCLAGGVTGAILAGMLCASLPAATSAARRFYAS